MKKILPVVFTFLVISFASKAQTTLSGTYRILTDSGHDNAKMLVGIIDKNDLVNDTAFKWYAESQRIYPHPDSAAVAAFSNNKDKVYFLIFGGTWCEDTHFILPKFYKIQQAANFPADHVTVFAVDHHMNTIGNMAKAMHITHTPTIVVMKDGKEMGRLVEYGKTGHWDKELADIVNE
ncbi:MAG: thioredoxin family protein [Bacteroidota bacterium]|nr:thioredoxin family protein [Bacteroidota bacterium]